MFQRWMQSWTSRLLYCAWLVIAQSFVVQEVKAHPHVWVTARAQLVFEEGKFSAVRHSWTFDDAYSQYAVQGLATNKDGSLNAEQLAELARDNIEGLHEFNFFTKAKADGKSVIFASPKDPSITYEDKALTLHFNLPVDAPIASKRSLVLEIYDPTYFVSFIFAPGQEAVRLAGDAKNCATTIIRPKQQVFDDKQELSEAFFNSLSASSTFGQDFATRAIIACP